MDASLSTSMANGFEIYQKCTTNKIPILSPSGVPWNIDAWGIQSHVAAGLCDVPFLKDDRKKIASRRMGNWNLLASKSLTAALLKGGEGN